MLQLFVYFTRFSIVIFITCVYTRKWFPLKSERAHSLFILSSAKPCFHLYFLVICSFILDERTIFCVDLIEMTLKGGIVESVHTTDTFQAFNGLEHGIVGA